MSKEKDLLAEIEHQEAVIAQATERLNVLRVDVYALRRETLRNKKPTAAMLDVLAKLAAGDAVCRFVGTRNWKSYYRLLSTDDRVPTSAIDGLRERECIQWRTEERARGAFRITDHGRAVLAKHQKGGTDAQ